MAPRMWPVDMCSTRSACLPGSALPKTCPYGGRLPAYDLDVCHCTHSAPVEVFSTEAYHRGLVEENLRDCAPWIASPTTAYRRSLGSKCHPYITFTRGCRNAKRRLAAWQNNSLPGCTRGRRPYDVIHLWFVAPRSEVQFAQILTRFVNSKIQHVWVPFLLSKSAKIMNTNQGCKYSRNGTSFFLFRHFSPYIDIQTFAWDDIFGPNQHELA